LAVSAQFSSYLIFYRYRNGELTVVRVLHGGMDLKRILGVIS
jgi:plasmid stabilization system protein ParE